MRSLGFKIEDISVGSGDRGALASQFSVLRSHFRFTIEVQALGIDAAFNAEQRSISTGLKLSITVFDALAPNAVSTMPAVTGWSSLDCLFLPSSAGSTGQWLADYPVLTNKSSFTPKAKKTNSEPIMHLIHIVKEYIVYVKSPAWGLTG